MSILPPYFDRRPLPLLHLAGWTIYVLADYADHALFGNYDPVPTLICGLAGYLFTGLIAIIDNRMRALGSPIARWSVFALIGAVSVLVWHKVYIVFHLQSGTPLEMVQEVAGYTAAEWMAVGYMPILLFLCWVAFFFLSKAYIAGRAKEDQLKDALLETKKAQLQTLRHQLNPHFLFNALNSVDVSARSGDGQTAHKMTQHLSRFLRTSLEQGEQDKIPLHQEVAMIQDFVAIEEVRFQDQLTVTIDVSDDAAVCLVPPMLLQPLMENAIKFAWSAAENGAVCMKARTAGEQLQISFENSFDEQESKHGTGTGLRNTRERLALVYGKDAWLETSVEDGSFYLDLILPTGREA